MAGRRRCGDRGRTDTDGPSGWIGQDRRWARGHRRGRGAAGGRGEATRSDRRAARIPRGCHRHRGGDEPARRVDERPSRQAGRRSGQPGERARLEHVRPAGRDTDRGDDRRDHDGLLRYRRADVRRPDAGLCPVVYVRPDGSTDQALGVLSAVGELSTVRALGGRRQRRASEPDRDGLSQAAIVF